MPETRHAGFEDMKLQVGAKLQLVLHRSSKTVYYTTLIGYSHGEYLLVKIPVERGLSVPIRDGEPVSVRVFSGVAVFAFDGYVESVQLSPHFYMHLSFPTQILSTPLRDAPRVKVSVPVQLRRAGESSPMHAVLTDLSISGAYITSGDRIGAPGETIAVAFSFSLRPTHQEVNLNVNATIRSSQENLVNGATQMLYGAGIQFGDLAPTDQLMLQHFLYEAEELFASQAAVPNTAA